HGIKREDVFIDCLTLTVSAEQEAVPQTLEAMRMVKSELGLKTVLGVSNISFGLPNRELVNHTFLTLALENGLDLPIINPNIASMTGVVRAYNLLRGIDKNATEFVACYNATPAAPADKPASAPCGDITLPQAIERGLRADSVRLTTALLETTAPMDIVSDMLIPALDSVGGKFEKGEIFLPQLILAADTAGACFDVIRDRLSSSDDSPESRGKIILATVRGDIHDIGKNIVKVLLQNYGYTVIDLGKDVPEQAVVDAALREDVRLIGLSALMTTTLPSMERTIALLRENNVDCKVMVGGAVLTAEYAEKIGADYYAKDAKEGVDVARRFFGN
ncbi:MAG: cobalamin-dependent protein, partial [Clostridia bacterium]|nr:cobalamin-dependent protein [Clostridia bacterium]